MKQNHSFLKFSIICPVFNSQNYLISSIQSVIKQTYSNWELILVDDGSTDRSSQICDSFSELYTQIITIHKINEGPYLARLLGIKKSSGEYILFLDSDDTFKKNYLSIINKILNKKNYDIVYFLANSNNKKIIYYGTELLKIKKSENYIHHLKKSILTSDYPNSCWLQCIKRKNIDLKQLINHKTKSIVAEDKIMSMIFLDNAKKIFLLDKSLYNYRYNKTSTIHRPFTLENFYNKYNKDLYNILIEFQNKWKLFDISQQIYDYLLSYQIQTYHAIFINNSTSKCIKIIKQNISKHIIKIENKRLFKTSKYFYFSKLLLHNNLAYLLLYRFIYRLYRLIKNLILGN